MVEYNNFILKEIPKLIPISIEYGEFWKTEKYNCVFGKWSGGYWMPGNLYFYTNHFPILLNKSKTSKSKTLGRPFLRDIDWEFFRGWTEARGFSGFEFDTEYTANRVVSDLERDDVQNDPIKKQLYEAQLTPDCFKEDGTLKTYLPAREYMSRQWPTNMGKPLYENQARNFIMLGNRGFGKSFSVAGGIISWEFLFVPSSEVVVGAGDAKYSSDLLQKVKMGLDNIEGGQYYAKKYYPAPFSKTYRGSFNPGKEVIAEYTVKIGNNWVTKGSRSRIKHRSFLNNPFAANGTRPTVLVMEEIGMFNNLEASFNACVETMRNNDIKFGSMMMLGTGGDFEAGGTRDAKKIFYDPETYDCVAYTDTWEPREGKIGYFVPAYLGLNDYKKKDEGTERCYSQTDEELAKASLLMERERLKKAKSQKRLDDELQNRPIVPSEMFLVSSGNIFPIQMLKEHKQQVEARNLHKKAAHIGYMSEDGKFVVDRTRDPLYEYPINPRNNNKGCVVIYEFPPKDEEIPYGHYIAGMDPYRFDGSEDSPSVGAMYIYKRYSDMEMSYDKIVASFVGRPETLKEFHEQCRLLLKYYNAECLYENEVNNFHQHLDMLGESYLLTDQPDALIKDIIDDSKVNRPKGIHMVPKIKLRGLQKARDWLLEKRGYKENGEELLNLHTILDLGLLEELISYNDEMNYDRVIAFMLTIMLDDYRYKIKVKKTKEESKKIDRRFISGLYQKTNRMQTTRFRNGDARIEKPKLKLFS